MKQTFKTEAVSIQQALEAQASQDILETHRKR